jgi:gas vesicle protein
MRSGSYESSDKSSAGLAITFLLIGLGAGALTALLLAPKAGKQLRRDLRKRYDDARDAVEDFADEARERISDAVDRGSEWVDTAREKVEPLRQAVRKR